MRLEELQRKLSEIAEIPKILSSTLATVSHTFDKLTTTLPPHNGSPPLYWHKHFQSQNIHDQLFDSEQKRKLSYDEDVYDYELSDDETKNEDDANNEEEEFNVKEAYQQLKLYAAARQRKSKDVTPESDYESESNFPQKETENKEQDDRMNDNYDIDGDNDITNNEAALSCDEDNETEKSCDMYEEFNLSLLKIPFDHCNNDSDIEEYDDENDASVNEKDSESDDDFLTTTFTWSLRNKPKLLANNKDNNDDNDEDDGDADAGDASNIKQVNIQEAENVFNVEQLQSLNNSKEVLSQKSYKADTPEKEQKMDKLERCWPWADRERIIYKQSTCHLVPQKPLGLIEQRIQLLAKRNLLEHINKIKNPQ